MMEIIKELKDPDGQWSYFITLKMIDKVLNNIKEMMDQDHE